MNLSILGCLVLLGGLSLAICVPAVRTDVKCWGENDSMLQWLRGWNCSVTFQGRSYRGSLGMNGVAPEGTEKENNNCGHFPASSRLFSCRQG